MANERLEVELDSAGQLTKRLFQLLGMVLPLLLRGAFNFPLAQNRT